MVQTTKDGEVASDLEVPQEEEIIEEKPKNIPPKPVISRSGPVFSNANQFRGWQGNNINNRQRPGRAAWRGR